MLHYIHYLYVIWQHFNKVIPSFKICTPKRIINPASVNLKYFL